MRYFTNNPLERLMMQKPKAAREDSPPAVSYTHLDVYKRQPIAEHSKKPNIIREKIVELAGDLPRIELFARQSPTGWDVWGNEVDLSLIHI